MKKTNKKKLFKNKTQMVIYIILFIALLSLFVVVGQIDFKKEKDTEATKFSTIYNLVDKDNLYVFSDATDVLNILKGRSGVIFLAFPSNKWSNKYASILNEVGKEVGLDKIYYYDFKKDRDESNGTYETVVNELDMYVPINDENEKNIQAPTVVIVKNGTIIAYFDDATLIKGPVTPDEYYNENQIASLKSSFKVALEEYLKGDK